MAPYITVAQLEAYIQDSLLTQGLDDNEDGAVDAGIFDQVYQAAEDEVHGFLEGRYAVPFTQNPPKLVLSACRILCAEALWIRRGNSGDQNPFSSAANAIRKRLEAIGKGDLPLSAEHAQRAGAGFVVSQPAVTGDPGRVAF